MSARKVFISYSHKDAELFGELMIHLAPFEHELLLHPWSDKDIEPSDNWYRRIREEMDTADAALLLVSPHFLASKFIIDEEVPRLIEARETGRLLLTALYLDHASAEVLKFDLDDRDTGERGIAITKYQGLNDPADPVRARSGAARSELLKCCVGKLRDLLAAQGDRRELRKQLKGRELTIELRLRDGHVDRRYSRPRNDIFLNDSFSLDRDFLARLCKQPPSEHSDRELGGELFRVLFGDENQCLTVLRRALGEEVRSPLQHAVRVRVLTREPELRELPWVLCSWRAEPLAESSSWTFELASRPDPQPLVYLHTPCPAIFVGADVFGFPSLDLETHHLCLEGICRRAWRNPPRGDCFSRAQTPAEALGMLAEEPRLVYVVAHAKGGARLEVVLRDENGEARSLPFSELAAIWAARPPWVVFLNTVGETPLVPSLPGVACVFHQRWLQPGEAMKQNAQLWWDAVLGESWEPVRAFHELGAPARRRGAVQTDYERWEATLSEHVSKADRPRAHLDRKEQRRVIWDAVRELAQDPLRRLTCVVAYGVSRNLVQHFAVQATATLKEWDPTLARIEHLQLQFPEQRAATTLADFEERFRYILGVQPGQSLDTALKPKLRGGPQAKPVLLLDWGCYGPGQLKALHSKDLETWLAFCRGYLVSACPAGVRILSYVALVVEG